MGGEQGASFMRLLYAEFYGGPTSGLRLLCTHLDKYIREKGLVEKRLGYNPEVALAEDTAERTAAVDQKCDYKRKILSIA